MLNFKNDFTGSKARFVEFIIIYILCLLSVVLINDSLLLFNHENIFIWNNSKGHNLIFSILIYSILYFSLPLLFTKYFRRLTEIDFLLPFLFAVVAIPLTSYFRLGTIITLLLLIFIHNKFDLTAIGIRTTDWKKDIFPFITLLILIFIPLLIYKLFYSSEILSSIVKVEERIFGSSYAYIEFLFFFGFGAERIIPVTGKISALILIPLLYLAIDYNNPILWSINFSYAAEFGILLITASVYLWRRNIVVLWLTAGIWRFLAPIVIS